MTYTENGAATYRSTQSECLDLFATIGALRRESDEAVSYTHLVVIAQSIADIGIPFIEFISFNDTVFVFYKFLILGKPLFQIQMIA